MPTLLPVSAAARSVSPIPGERQVARLRLSDDSLEATARRAAGGDHSAFEQLHSRFAAGIYRFFEKRSGREAAEELAQHTWSELWRAVSQGAYQPDRAAFSTFAYAVAGNVWRRSRRDAARSAPTPVPPANDEDFVDALGHAELLDALRACLHNENDGLTDVERQVVLSLATGDSEREIARVQGVAPSTIHDRKQSGMNKLRRMLAERGFHGPEQDAPDGQ